MSIITLALIGSGIDRSWAPRLHETAGRLCGLDVRYELRALETVDPAALDGAISRCIEDGCTGINVTHPFKEMAARRVQCASETVRRLGAVNTIRFGDGAALLGHNTDHSGFVQAFRRRFGDSGPGDVAIAGCGGAGRSVAFGLAVLGAARIRLFDVVEARSAALAADLRALDPALEVQICRDGQSLTTAADGFANCTPVGMYQYPGTPLVPRLLHGRRWVFDAVYTPLRTPLLCAAAAAGAACLSGFELFLFQGIDAFEIFTGARVDEAALRRAFEPVAGAGVAAGR